MVVPLIKENVFHIFYAYINPRTVIYNEHSHMEVTPLMVTAVNTIMDG